jgi:pyruvate dehydrogenase E1 component alpha subunit
MRAAAEEAIAAARDGKGPRFIEAVAYRLGDHTTSDDASRYRSADEVQAHWKEEPVARLRTYLVGQKMWGKADEEQLATESQTYAAQRRELAGEDDARGNVG